MKKLKKADFYFGAFYSYLFTRKFKPALIDDSETYRQLSIYTDTNPNGYNLYTMYRSESDKILDDGKK